MKEIGITYKVEDAAAGVGESKRVVTLIFIKNSTIEWSYGAKQIAQQSQINSLDETRRRRKLKPVLSFPF